MKTIIRLCLVASLLSAAVSGEPWRLVMTVEDNAGNVLGANIIFDADKAYEYGPEITETPDAVFDLGRQEWIDIGSSRRITLASAQAWAEVSKSRTLASLGQAPDPDTRAFAQSLIQPEFVITESPSALVLKSRFLSYTASAPLPLNPGQLRALWAYDELNAYRKAMGQRQMPPFTQLKVTQILKEKGMYPGSLVMTITTPNGSVEAVITYSLTVLAPAELALFERARR